MKIGNHVGSLKGKCLNKALPSKVYGMPRIETTAECDGDLAGKPVKTLATSQAEMRSDGRFIGDCPNSGVVLAADGVATFRANGVGKPTAEGGFSFRGPVYFETTSASLASLNGVAHFYEWEVDAENNATWKIWACE